MLFFLFLIKGKIYRSLTASFIYEVVTGTGYNYVLKHYSFLAMHSPQSLWKLGTAYFQEKGATAELARGMGFNFLELEIKMLLSQTVLEVGQEDDSTFQDYYYYY